MSIGYTYTRNRRGPCIFSMQWSSTLHWQERNITNPMNKKANLVIGNRNGCTSSYCYKKALLPENRMIFERQSYRSKSTFKQFICMCLKWERTMDLKVFIVRFRYSFRYYSGHSLSGHSQERPPSLMWPTIFAATFMNAFVSPSHQRSPL